MFAPRTFVRVNTDIGFDEEGIPVAIAFGAKGLVSYNQDKDSEFVQVIVNKTGMELCVLGVKEEFLELWK